MSPDASAGDGGLVMDGVDDVDELDELEAIEVTEEQTQTLMDLEQRLENNPTDYEAHVRYVGLLRACRLREKLREARILFQQAFPLTENMWLQWVEDESEALETMEDVARLEALLRKSHEDYMSVSLWKEHAEVSIARFEQRKAKGEAEEVAASAVREVFNEALADCGLHVVEGATLWNMCLDFELNNLQESARDNARIERLFSDFLACAFPPEVLLGARERYAAWRRGSDDRDMERKGHNEMEEFERDGRGGQDRQEQGEERVPRAMEKTIERAMRAYELRRGHEEAIIVAKAMDSNGITLLSVYASYLEMEASSGAGNENRVRTVFERALVDFPTSDYIWKSYLDWMDAKGDVFRTPCSLGQALPKSQSLPALVRRALRNCPWSGDVWAWRFETLDPDSNFDAELDRCRQFLMTNAPEFQKAVMAYIGRAADAPSSSTAQNKERLLRECLGLLRQQNVVDPEHRCAWLLSSMMVQSQIDGGKQGGHGESLEAGVAVWEGLVAEGKLDSQYSGTWISYYQFLVRYGGDTAAKRAVFQRAVRSHMSAADKAYVARSWLSFEEREGTSKDFFEARRQTLDVMRQVEATQRGITLELDQVNVSLAEVEKRKRRQQNDPNFIEEGKKNNKRAKQVRKTQNKVGKGASGWQRPENQKKQEPSKKRKGDRACTTQNGNMASADAKKSSEGLLTHSEGAPTADNNVTVFIKYIDGSVTKEELAAELAPCGLDMEISLARDSKTGRSKGFAYVTCSRETSDKLCGLNGMEYRGKRLLIAPSDPVKASTVRGNRKDRKSGLKRRNQNHSVSQPKQSQRTKLGGAPATMLVPRAATTTNIAGSATAPKSNDEFRRMFMRS